MIALADASDVAPWPWQVWALAAATLLLLWAAHTIATRRNTRSTRATTPRVERCPTDRCSVLVADNGLPCNEPATVSVHAGHDYWPMCIGHGLPFLTEEMRA